MGRQGGGSETRTCAVSRKNQKFTVGRSEQRPEAGLRYASDGSDLLQKLVDLIVQIRRMTQQTIGGAQHLAGHFVGAPDRQGNLVHAVANLVGAVGRMPNVAADLASGLRLAFAR